MLVERMDERTLKRELARELASESARELARESARELARDSARELALELACELSFAWAMREPGREGGPLETGRLLLKRVGVNLLSSWAWLSKLLRFVACDGERLLLAREFLPDRLDKLAKSLSGELERLFGYES